MTCITEVLRSFLFSQIISTTTTSSAILKRFGFGFSAFPFVVPHSTGGRLR